MEPSKDSAILDYIYPPAPTTSRGQNISLSSNPAKSKIVYTTSNIIVIRDINDPTKAEYFHNHIAETSAARYSPNGNLIASGDEKGNLKIWDAEGAAHNVKKEYECYLGGKIRDIAWTADGQRICIAGEGSGVYARVFIADTGSQVGEVSAISRILLTCDFGSLKPLKLVVGGEENLVNIYEGPPFKFKKTNKGHSNFVNCIRYNPRGDTFVSVSSDSKIIVYDGETAEEKAKLTDKAHTGTVSYCDFINDLTLVTCSFDKSVKVWNLLDNTCTKTLQIKDSPSIDDMQVAVQGLGDDIGSFSLDGTLNLWRNYALLENAFKPTERYHGHNTSIVGVEYSYPLNLLVSADNNRIFIWSDRKAQVPTGVAHSKTLKGIALSSDEKLVFSYDVNNTLKIIDLTSKEYKKSVDLKHNIRAFAPSKADPDTLYVGTDKKKILVLKGIEIKREFDIEFEPTCMDVTNKDQYLIYGDKEGLVHIVDIVTGKLVQKLTHSSSARVTVVKVSKYQDTFLVTGDSAKKIILWSLTDYKILTSDWVFHNASITSLQFSKTNSHVISSAQDNKVIVWSTVDYTKPIELVNVHKKGVFGATFKGESSFVSGGGDNLLKEYTTQLKYI